MLGIFGNILIRNRCYKVNATHRERWPGTIPKKGTAFPKMPFLADQNCLAAGFLDLLLCGLGELVRMHRDRRREFAITEDLE